MYTHGIIYNPKDRQHARACFGFCSLARETYIKNNDFKNKSNSLASTLHGLIDKPLNRRRR